MTDHDTSPELRDELAELRSRLAEAEETLRAIRGTGNERSVVESEARYRELFESNPQPMWVYDLETLAFLAVNDAAVAHYGYRREEFLSMTILDLHPPGKRLELMETVRQVPGPMRRVGVWPQIRKDGAIREVEIATHDVNFSGRAARLVLSNDITDRKRAEDALRASQQLIEGIINAIPVRVFWKDRNLVYLGCNAAFARDAGFADPKQVIGKDDFQMGWREQADLYRNDDRQVIESGASKYLIEEPQTTPEGRTITLLTSKLPLRNSSGEISGVLGTYIDITDRKRVETELREAEARHRLLFDQSPDGIVIIDPVTARLLEFNETAHRQLGYPREEFAQLSLADIEAADTPEDARARIARVTREGRSDFETRHCTRQGEIRIIHVTAQSMAVQGRPVYHCVWRDVTEQLRLAGEKARLEEQLLQSQKIEAIGRLAGGVAHDFNNLTAIVLGYGEMLLGQLRPEEPAHTWAEQIVEAGKRSAALTRQLLAFSRKQTLQPEVLDLNALLLNLEKMLVRLIGEDIRLELKLAADLGRVTADPGQVEQVVMNLVLNARDAMPRGGRLTVETADVELDETYALDHAGVVPGRYVMLALTDTGCGMDKATLARLFEPFFTTKEGGKGTGLGLATAFGIVKQSGGHLYAYSELGKGATFKIYLPWTDAAPTVWSAEVAAEMPRGSGERILLVEDEAPLRDLCAAVLSGLGYLVGAAESGPEALLLVEKGGFEPDLVLTDVVMPGMSGAELVDRLRTGRPYIRTLYMSGYPDEAITRHGVLDRGTHFLQKPFSERALATKVRQSMGGEATGTQPARRVLMIDDDEQFRELVRHFCTKRDHVFAGVGDAAAAIAALAGQPFDVLLVDLTIPGTSGEHVLREIRAAGHAAPAIVLTGDVASADMDLLRPLGVVRALEKSSSAEPLLQAIAEA